MKSWKILAALFAVLLFLSACSDDGGSDDNASDDQSSQEDSSSDDSGDSGDESTDDTEIDIPDSDDLEDLPGGDCVEFAAAYGSLYAAAGAGVLSADQAEEVQAQIDDLEPSVPDDIQEEWDIVAEAFANFADAVANNAITSDEVAEASDAIGSPEVQEAQETISTYLQAECS